MFFFVCVCFSDRFWVSGSAATPIVRMPVVSPGPLVLFGRLALCVCLSLSLLGRLVLGILDILEDIVVLLLHLFLSYLWPVFSTAAVSHLQSAPSLFLLSVSAPYQQSSSHTSENLLLNAFIPKP